MEKTVEEIQYKLLREYIRDGMREDIEYLNNSRECGMHNIDKMLIVSKKLTDKIDALIQLGEKWKEIKK